MKKVKSFIVLCVLLILVLLVTMAIVFTRKSQSPTSYSVSEQDNAKNHLSALSTSEHMSASVTEEGESVLVYYNMERNAGNPHLVIPSEYENLRVKSVDLTWYENDEKHPVTYLKSIRFEEGIQKLLSNLENVNHLEAVYIPASFSSIPKHAFDSCRETVTLWVVKGSYGEVYAKKRGITYKYQKQ